VRGRLKAVAAARGLTPFVGREDELRLLLNRWERVLEGERSHNRGRSRHRQITTGTANPEVLARHWTEAGETDAAIAE
jgi:hypothetical protein